MPERRLPRQSSSGKSMCSYEPVKTLEHCHSGYILVSTGMVSVILSVKAFLRERYLSYHSIKCYMAK
jgi:hypothetical protein